MPPGFPSSFETPDTPTVERYKKFKAVANPDGGASPNEMAIAHREIEKLEAKYPSIRAIASIPSTSSPATGFQPGHGPSVLDLLSEVWGSVRSVARARLLATDSVEIASREMQDGRLRFTVTVDSRALDQVFASFSDLERHQFASGVAERLHNEILAAFYEAEEG